MVNWREIEGERVVVLDEDEYGWGSPSLLGKGHIEAEKFCRIARQVVQELGHEDEGYDPAAVIYMIGRWVPGYWLSLDCNTAWYPSEPGRGAFEGTRLYL